MKLSEGLYTYNISNRKRNRICSHIRKHKSARNLFVIVLPVRGNDGILEIYPYNQLLQSYYRQFDSEITVVGLAKKREDAQMLVLEIIQDMYDTTGEEFDVKKFFVVNE